MAPPTTAAAAPAHVLPHQSAWQQLNSSNVPWHAPVHISSHVPTLICHSMDSLLMLPLKLLMYNNLPLPCNLYTSFWTFPWVPLKKNSSSPLETKKALPCPKNFQCCCRIETKLFFRHELVVVTTLKARHRGRDKRAWDHGEWTVSRKAFKEHS